MSAPRHWVLTKAVRQKQLWILAGVHIITCTCCCIKKLAISQWLIVKCIMLVHPQTAKIIKNHDCFQTGFPPKKHWLSLVRTKIKPRPKVILLVEPMLLFCTGWNALHLFKFYNVINFACCCRFILSWDRCILSLKKFHITFKNHTFQPKVTSQ